MLYGLAMMDEVRLDGRTLLRAGAAKSGKSEYCLEKYDQLSMYILRLVEYTRVPY